MAKQAAEGLINHYNGLRFRLTGSGNLKLLMLSLSQLVEHPLVAMPMATVTNIEPFRLANFKQQRVQLRVSTTEINEYFLVSKIVFYSKPIESGYPG